MREALYYQPHPTGVQCRLCPKACIIAEGKSGFCRVRQNINNKLYSHNYAACSASALDPIEKKPLFHFYPGRYILSVGTWGCNFSCKFCQNWQIAQDKPEVIELPPDRLVSLARQQGENNIGIAFTYSEPSVWYEYILDTAIASQAAGLKNVLVTNGFINPEPLQRLLPYIDALNIDVKAFSEDYYHKICAGRLDDVKQTVQLAAQSCHVEITTLIVPDLNDAEEELAALARWLAGINPAIPLHFSRYYPNYQLTKAATPINTMHRAAEVAKTYLQYVYLGNIGTSAINTYCPDCKQLVLNRITRTSYLMPDKKCPQCGSLIRIVGEVCYS